MKNLFHKMPPWFVFVWVVVMIMIVVNFFIVESSITVLAITILSIANAIRIWKNQRHIAVAFLIIAVLCIAGYLTYLFS